MPYDSFKLPVFPCKSDMWCELKREKRPIVIYGMGNGADKLIAKFRELDINFADIFASDGYVRGHSFHGIRVKSFSEIKESYSEFVIVLSFASNREEVIEMLLEIDGEYDMYIPDMPVAGNEYFDSNFYNMHYQEIISAYDSLRDEESKNCFAAVVNYKLTGKMPYLIRAYSSRDELYGLIASRKKITSYVDGGAYNGDTLKEALVYFKDLKRAALFEPDARNFKKLSNFAKTVESVFLELYNSALWSSEETLDFLSSGNRNSSLNSTASYESKSLGTNAIMLDSALKQSVDFIKYDLEGAELSALIGSSETIKKYKPLLLVSAYHRSSDVFSLVNYLTENYPFYDLYLRRLKCVPAWELDIIAIPKEKSC